MSSVSSEAKPVSNLGVQSHLVGLSSADNKGSVASATSCSSLVDIIVAPLLLHNFTDFLICLAWWLDFQKLKWFFFFSDQFTPRGAGKNSEFYTEMQTWIFEASFRFYNTWSPTDLFWACSNLCETGPVTPEWPQPQLTLGRIWMESNAQLMIPLAYSACWESVSDCLWLRDSRCCAAFPSY